MTWVSELNILAVNAAHGEACSRNNYETMLPAGRSTGSNQLAQSLHKLQDLELESAEQSTRLVMISCRLS